MPTEQVVKLRTMPQIDLLERKKMEVLVVRPVKDEGKRRSHMRRARLQKVNASSVQGCNRQSSASPAPITTRAPISGSQVDRTLEPQAT